MDRERLDSPALGRERGASLVELAVVVTLAVTIAAISAPLASATIDNGKVRAAAAFISARFRLARIEAVSRGANVGVTFDQVNGSWQLRACRDGNRNGLRRAEIATGTDPCFDGPHEFAALFPGVAIVVDPWLVGPAGEPGNPDPVRFGTADVASFSPTGSCTAGSLFLRSVRGQAVSIRVSGANGRLRVFRYDAGPKVWLQL